MSKAEKDMFTFGERTLGTRDGRWKEIEMMMNAT
jgi:hypothetical protein